MTDSPENEKELHKKTKIKEILKHPLLFKNLKMKIYKTIILPVVLYECETWPHSGKNINSGCLRSGG
jgi:hypothetical protein